MGRVSSCPFRCRTNSLLARTRSASHRRSRWKTCVHSIFLTHCCSSPSIIQSQRPIENYWIQLSVLKDKLHLNEPLKDDQFALSRPSGSQFINLDQKNGNTTALVGQPSQDKPKPQQ